MFNYTLEELKASNSYWTATEIYQQPATWVKTLNQIKSEKAALKAFLAQVLDREDYDVILTGAGTSEFVGNALFSELNKLTNYKTKSFGTTDLVAMPQNYLSTNKPTLLVSFGRSGNSPESLGAVNVANEVCGENIYHLFVTCNHEGALSKFAHGKTNCYAINLTPETHDQSFAMTSSFSNMYLATYLAFNLDCLEELSAKVEEIVAQGQKFLDTTYALTAKLVGEYNFDRIVYLGSNVNKGVSQETALKMCELTAGQTVTMFDTPLGFRHGPKSIVNPTTLTVVFLSDDAYTRQYEVDLIKEMSGQREGNRLLAVSSKHDAVVESLVDYFISFENNFELDNIFLGLEFVMVGQLIALFKSLSLGVTPDNPCPSGVVNRVVKGVTLYDYTRRVK